MSSVTTRDNTKQYELRLRNHLHECSGITALERHNYLVSRAGFKRFMLVYLSS